MITLTLFSHVYVIMRWVKNWHFCVDKSLLKCPESFILSLQPKLQSLIAIKFVCGGIWGQFHFSENSEEHKIPAFSKTILIKSSQVQFLSKQTKHIGRYPLLNASSSVKHQKIDHVTVTKQILLKIGSINLIQILLKCKN